MMTHPNTETLQSSLLSSDGFYVGQEVYLSQEYYEETDVTVLDVPRYGWQVKAVSDGIATIEYQRYNIKLLMSLLVETRFLRKQV